MMKLLLSSAAAMALLVATPALAATDEPAADIQEQPAATEQPAPDSMSGSPETAVPKEEESVLFGSYKDQSGAFAGAVVGGYSAESLLGRDVIDISGDTVGEISDLLIGPNNMVSQVMIDVGGFLGIGSKTVALELAELQFEQGEGGAARLNMTAGELETLPQYHKTEDGWQVKPL